MKREVLITILGTHSDERDSYTTEMSVVGTMEHTGEGYTLVYENTQEDFSGCQTTLKYDGTIVSITHSGDYTTQMTMQREKRHSCHYITPFGEIVMGVFARRIDSRMTPQGGRLILNYTIDVNADLASSNELKINVSEV